MSTRFSTPLVLAVILFLAIGSALAQPPAAETLVLTVRGLGTSADAAKKDALMNAVHQAVGSFVHSETLVRNHELIKDQLLQVSDGFVHGYEILSGPDRRDDGLFEIAIKATVKKGKVIERLREVRVMSGSVPGKDVVAEVITKIENSQQGAALIQNHLDGLMKRLLVARLLDENGKPSQNIRPTTHVLEDNRLLCLWKIEVYFDLKTFYEQVVPQLDKVFTAAAAATGGPVVSISGRTGKTAASLCPVVFWFSERTGKTDVSGYPVVEHRRWVGEMPPEQKVASMADTYVFLSIGRDKYGENERFRWYLLQGNAYRTTLQSLRQSVLNVKLNLYFLADGGGVIRQDQVDLQGNAIVAEDEDDPVTPYLPCFLANEYTVNDSVMVSPRFARRARFSTDTSRAWGHHSGSCCDTMLIFYGCVLEQEDLEKLVEIRFSFAEVTTASRD